MNKIIPIILSGGAGARLWPVSRRMYPKQFMAVAGKPLLAHALERAAQVSDKSVIVTNQDHYFLTEKLLKDTQKAPNISFLLEPKVRNTAPAIALAVRHIQKLHGDDAICLVLAADHLISDDAAFQKAINQAAEQAQAGNLVVFGVRPTCPETGYGYLEVNEMIDGVQQPLKSFVEKPDRATAEGYLAEGRYFWNSGMFCFSAGVMIENMKLHASDVWEASEIAFADAHEEDDVIRFSSDSFVAQPDISIDYAVMEKADKIIMVQAAFGWSDVGSWDAVAGTHDADASGNSVVGVKRVHFVEAENIHVEGTHKEKVIAIIGVENLVIVETPDALLVANREKSQDVKLVVDALKKSADSEIVDYPSTVHRPWGTYATLKQEDGYQVKRITVAPGQKLSLQYHHRRAEHWIVTQGKAMVQIGEEEFETNPGEYRYIPLGEMHRLTNTGLEELILIEVQVGEYLGEDDIVRLEDDYGRV